MSHIEWENIAKKIGATSFNPNLHEIQEEAAQAYIQGVNSLVSERRANSTDPMSLTEKIRRSTKFHREMVHLKSNIIDEYVSKGYEPSFIIDGLNTFLI
jgi:hypothetical protein